jgi:hypothetical protein
MKKLFYPAIFLIATVCFFNSCAEEDPAQGVSIEGTFTSQATIEGYAYLSTNKSSSEAIKYAPEGTVLSFTISYSDLGISGSSGNYVKTTSVKADGSYSVELPARADGNQVAVSISGAEILLKITTDDGKSTDQVFKVDPTSQSIVAGFTYLKKLEYIEKEALQESETWKEATYQVKLEYNDGKTKRVVKDTEVKITVPKTEFVPERINDWVFFEKVGSNGSLEIKIGAPSLLDGGLSFTWELAFSAEAFTRYDTDPNTGDQIQIYDNYVFTASRQATIYGEKLVDAGTVSATRGAKLTNN